MKFTDSSPCAAPEPAALPQRRLRSALIGGFRQRVLCAGFVALVLGLAAPTLAAQKATLVEVRLLWGRGAENSDPDLLFHRERWFCVLRENGAVRILSSPDAKVWQSNAILELPEEDLGHPSLSATPDGKFLLSSTAHSKRVPGPPPRTFLWTSPDGREWEGPVQPFESGILLNVVRWRLNRAYAFGIDVWQKEPLRLYSSPDGLKYSLHAAAVAESPDAWPLCLFFARDGKALAILQGAQVQLGESRPPYRAWSWRELSAQGAVVAMAQTPDARIVAAATQDNAGPGLALVWLDPDKQSWSPFLRLPSKGAGLSASLLAQGRTLLVAYSSTHEGRKMVYLAEVLLGRD